MTIDYPSVIAALDTLAELSTCPDSEDTSRATAAITSLVHHQRTFLSFATSSLAPHQLRQRQLAAKEEEVAKEQARIQRLVDHLRSEQKRLEDVLAKAQAARLAKNNANNNMDNARIINYARRLAKFTSPPTNPNIPNINPPIPQDAHMKKSMLFAAHAVLAEATEDAAANDDEMDQTDDVFETDILEKLTRQAQPIEQEEEDNELNFDL